MWRWMFSEGGCSILKDTVSFWTGGDESFTVSDGTGLVPTGRVTFLQRRKDRLDIFRFLHFY